MIPLKDNVPTTGQPVVTIILIAITVLVFAWQTTLPDDRATSTELALAGLSERDEVDLDYGAIPYRITHPADSECGVTLGEAVCGAEALESAEAGTSARAPTEVDLPPWWVTLITSLFLHADLLHVLVAMGFLWIFGRNVEAAMGPWRFAAFYLLAGIVASYAQAALDPDSAGPMIGASGAVAGVLGAYAMLLPWAKVLNIVLVPIFSTLVQISALVMIGLYFALEIIPAVSRIGNSDLAEPGGVTFLAHVGGFLFGVATARLFARHLPVEPEAETATSRTAAEHG